ncbi:MAG: methyltransferase [Thermotogae bacterium]|nr:methyltransferase [Thermotogota bacterium]
MLTKQHEILLQSLGDFPDPKPHLEQYPTPPSVAVDMLNRARGDIAGKVVFDLGCGTGMLSVGAALAGADMVVGVDVDSDALKTAKRNVAFAEEVFGPLRIYLVRARIPQFHFRADTVVMNPPFGMRRKGSDREFLLAAMEGANVVWTLLGHDSDPFVRRLAEDMGFAWERVRDYPLTLRRTMRFHRRDRRTVRVSLYRLERVRFSTQ